MYTKVKNGLMAAFTTIYLIARWIGNRLTDMSDFQQGFLVGYACGMAFIIALAMKMIR